MDWPRFINVNPVEGVARQVNTLFSGGVCARVTGAQLRSSDSLRWIWLGVNYTVRLKTTFWRTFASVEATGWKSCCRHPEATSGPLLVDRFREGNPRTPEGGGRGGVLTIRLSNDMLVQYFFDSIHPVTTFIPNKKQALCTIFLFRPN